MDLIIANVGNIDDAEFSAAVAAISKQVALHFQPEWGATANITGTVLALDQPQVSIDGPTDAIVYVGTSYQDPTTDVGTVAAYHATNHGHLAYGFVYMDICQQNGEAWTVGLSHEVLELLADPNGLYNVAGPSPKKDGSTVYYALEVCDPTQGDCYPVDGVSVSNFVTRAYYGQAGGASKTNYLNLKLDQFGVRPGGYVQYSHDQTVDIINGDKVFPDKIAARKILGEHRRNSRRTGKFSVTHK